MAKPQRQPLELLAPIRGCKAESPELCLTTETLLHKLHSKLLHPTNHCIIVHTFHLHHSPASIAFLDSHPCSKTQSATQHKYPSPKNLHPTSSFSPSCTVPTERREAPTCRLSRLRPLLYTSPPHPRILSSDPCLAPCVSSPSCNKIIPQGPLPPLPISSPRAGAGSLVLMHATCGGAGAARADNRLSSSYPAHLRVPHRLTAAAAVAEEEASQAAAHTSPGVHREEEASRVLEVPACRGAFQVVEDPRALPSLAEARASSEEDPSAAVHTDLPSLVQTSAEEVREEAALVFLQEDLARSLEEALVRGALASSAPEAASLEEVRLAAPALGGERIALGVEAREVSLPASDRTGVCKSRELPKPEVAAASSPGQARPLLSQALPALAEPGSKVQSGFHALRHAPPRDLPRQLRLLSPWTRPVAGAPPPSSKSPPPRAKAAAPTSSSLPSPPEFSPSSAARVAAPRNHPAPSSCGDRMP